jgi:hypothetical protein
LKTMMSLNFGCFKDKNQMICGFFRERMFFDLDKRLNFMACHASETRYIKLSLF